jgi:hypothetical protein
MANEIDLYKDLEYCDKALKLVDFNTIAHKEWLKERARVIAQIKKQYPELALNNK